METDGKAAAEREKIVHSGEDPKYGQWSRCPIPCEFGQLPITSVDGGRTWRMEGDEKGRLVSACPFCGVELG